MSIFQNEHGLPGYTPALIKALDQEIQPAIVRGSEDIDLFELGKQAGRRELVDQLKHALERQQREALGDEDERES